MSGEKTQNLTLQWPEDSFPSVDDVALAPLDFPEIAAAEPIAPAEFSQWSLADAAVAPAAPELPDLPEPAEWPFPELAMLPEAAEAPTFELAAIPEPAQLASFDLAALPEPAEAAPYELAPLPEPAEAAATAPVDFPNAPRRALEEMRAFEPFEPFESPSATPAPLAPLATLFPAPGTTAVPSAHEWPQLAPGALPDAASFSAPDLPFPELDAIGEDVGLADVLRELASILVRRDEAPPPPYRPAHLIQTASLQ
jgi:hypothetical protein